MASKKAKLKPVVRCDVCGARDARIHRVARTYGRGKDLLVIENIPIAA